LICTSKHTVSVEVTTTPTTVQSTHIISMLLSQFAGHIRRSYAEGYAEDKNTNTPRANIS
jgi:hypothetical protein